METLTDEQKTMPTRSKVKPGQWGEGHIATIFPKGFGFISQGFGKPDVFVRSAEVAPEFWIVGQRLRFQMQPPAKGRAWVAVHVHAVDAEGKEL